MPAEAILRLVFLRLLDKATISRRAAAFVGVFTVPSLPRLRRRPNASTQCSHHDGPSAASCADVFFADWPCSGLDECFQNRRIFGAHAPHPPAELLRSSLTH